MWRRLPVLALTTIVLFAPGSSAADKPKVRIVVYAKASDKLCPLLAALQLSDGTYVGQTRDAGVVVEVPDASAAAAVDRLESAGASDIKETVPASVERIDTVILIYTKGKKPAAADLGKLGFQVDSEFDEAAFLFLKPTGPLTAKAIAALAQLPGVRSLQLDRRLDAGEGDKAKPG
jgi:hypothetical protein